MRAAELVTYLEQGVETVLKGILKASFHCPQESLFMLHYIKNSRFAKQRRKELEEEGLHVPPFLMASITDQCNLHCKGCYARAKQGCHDLSPKENLMMTREQWGSVFRQASRLGISFILLAGGEPFVRMEILKEAGKYKEILFPVITNGTFMDQESIQLLTANRNLIPVISLEGELHATEERRGSGIYQVLCRNMEQLHTQKILFGVSVTVTKENREEVLSQEFVRRLKEKGCSGILYIEYVPVEEGDQCLAPDDRDRQQMMEQLDYLRSLEKQMLLIAFPGDEKRSGGCLAAGRGFFHINARGGAEPCPFSPYSDTSLKHVTLKEALQSPLFCRLRDHGNLEKEHTGGCTLVQQEQEVQRLLKGEYA